MKFRVDQKEEDESTGASLATEAAGQSAASAQVTELETGRAAEEHAELVDSSTANPPTDLKMWDLKKKPPQQPTHPKAAGNPRSKL